MSKDQFPVSMQQKTHHQTAIAGLMAGFMSFPIALIPVMVGDAFMWRSLAHMVGFAGMAACLVALLSQPHGDHLEKSLPRLFLATAGGWAILWLANQAGALSPFTATAMATIILTATCARAVIDEITNWTTGRYALQLSVLFCLAISWSWEMYNQPLVDVYGAGPRGAIQWEQVFADAIGTVLGASWAAWRHRHATVLS
ncbi:MULTISPECIES: hypothetical protein [Pseudomonadaceae]|uniref:Uncharacterized protein n=1 Tax=Stutzerimonas stutzeri TaxID=316 RepID=A0ABD4XW57_STUST|nr:MULTISPECIES: hypothetical protein [Pseudomonadaceae]MDH0687105.1 hypothetical protein [Stutzerimonas stutzeri]MDS9628965.1 hypothetical protein [Pseudomonas aeruginosa]